MSGSAGQYTLSNLVMRNKYSPETFCKLANSDKFKFPPKVRKDLEPISPSHPNLQESEERTQQVTTITPKSSPAYKKSNPQPLHTKKRANPQLEPWNFADIEMNLGVYNLEYCQALEKEYWRSLAYQPPLYGADLEGSLFDPNVKVWNVQNLGDLLQQMPFRLRGVNTAYLYFGMWRSTFPWHVEDMDLFSINYIHRGAPKQWYSISSAHKQRFEMIMKSTFSTDAVKCPQFMRHKRFLLSPSQLAGQNIQVNRLIHYQREFVITFPQGYHSGYNMGFNVAESINFATEDWLPIGLKAKVCKCTQDSIRFDVGEVFADIIDPELLEPRERESSHNSLLSTPQPKKTRGRTAKLVTPEDSTKKAKISRTKKSPKSRPQLQNFPEIDKYCVLCPSYQGTTVRGSNGHWAHEVCARLLPETDLVRSNLRYPNEPIALGLDSIPKHRWGHQCTSCKKTFGIGLKCHDDSCTKYFHPTCVANQHLEIKQVQNDESGASHIFYCVDHTPDNFRIRTRHQSNATISSDVQQLPLLVNSIGITSKLPSQRKNSHQYIENPGINYNLNAFPSI
jgi:hypothetical protein